MVAGWCAISACMTCFSLERTPVLSQYNRSISRMPCQGEARTGEPPKSPGSSSCHCGAPPVTLLHDGCPDSTGKRTGSATESQAVGNQPDDLAARAGAGNHVAARTSWRASGSDGMGSDPPLSVQRPGVVHVGPYLCGQTVDLSLSDFRFRRNAKFAYVYDMGCWWEHELLHVRVSFHRSLLLPLHHPVKIQLLPRLMTCASRTNDRAGFLDAPDSQKNHVLAVAAHLDTRRSWLVRACRPVATKYTSCIAFQLGSLARPFFVGC